MNNRFKILVSGHLPAEWSSVVGSLIVACQPDGNTLITGELIDQAALYGLLTNLRDWGLTLISVVPMSCEGNGHQEATAKTPFCLTSKEN